ncbi:hypothetical protein C8R43DRAFT_961737 [Mycena crocata]|nr:hypothetical protein C8R43DRAFT_961737 [Mycena crocata]
MYRRQSQSQLPAPTRKREGRGTDENSDGNGALGGGGGSEYCDGGRASWEKTGNWEKIFPSTGRGKEVGMHRALRLLAYCRTAVQTGGGLAENTLSRREAAVRHLGSGAEWGRGVAFAREAHTHDACRTDGFGGMWHGSEWVARGRIKWGDTAGFDGNEVRLGPSPALTTSVKLHFWLWHLWHLGQDVKDAKDRFLPKTCVFHQKGQKSYKDALVFPSSQRHI